MARHDKRCTSRVKRRSRERRGCELRRDRVSRGVFTCPQLDPRGARSYRFLPMRPVTNDFSIHVATVNGSGSQTANNVLLRAIFQMGIPVSGKNLFPSNIAGLPTWFTIRASAAGWIARRAQHEILVVMNPETATADGAEMGAGGVIVVNDAIRLPPLPEDRIVYAVPMAKLMEGITTDVKLRRLVVNMVYVGVLAELLGIEAAEVDRAMHAQLGRKPKALALNQGAVTSGMTYAREHLPKRDPY